MNDNVFVIYAIESAKLLDHPLYKNGKMTFYVDPCYNGKVGGISACEAIYTYSNIPRELLENRCFVYDMHNDNGYMSAELKQLKNLP